METFALVADRLWDGRGDVAREGLAVLVRGAQIEAIAPLGEIPPRAAVRRFPGCTLIPGLMDAHVHYSTVMGPAFLAAGVTTIRDVGNDLDWILGQRARHAANPRIGPAILCCGFLLDGPKAYWRHMGRAHASAQDVRASVREEAARGVDAIKLYAGADLELIRAAVEESRLVGKPTLAHLGPLKAEDTARAGLGEIQHLTGCGAAWKDSTLQEKDALIDILLEHGVAMTPTLVVWDRLGRILDPVFANDERRKWVHPVFRDVWERYLTRSGPPEPRLKLQTVVPWMKNCLARMSERGVSIAVGTDTPFPHLVPGFSVHDELAQYVDAGIAPSVALRAATSGTARVLGISGQKGHLAPGMAADLVAVRGDPLKRIEDLSGVEATVRSGVVLEPAALLESLQATYGSIPEDTITRDLLGYVNRA